MDDERIHRRERRGNVTRGKSPFLSSIGRQSGHQVQAVTSQGQHSFYSLETTHLPPPSYSFCSGPKGVDGCVAWGPASSVSQPLEAALASAPFAQGSWLSGVAIAFPSGAVPSLLQAPISPRGGRRTASTSFKDRTLFRASTCGGSQPRSLIGAVAAGLHHSHRNVRSELRLRCVCDLHQSSWQHWILNPLSEARDRTLNLVVPSRIRFRCATRAAPERLLEREFLLLGGLLGWGGSPLASAPWLGSTGWRASPVAQAACSVSLTGWGLCNSPSSLGYVSTAFHVAVLLAVNLSGGSSCCLLRGPVAPRKPWSTGCPWCGFCWGAPRARTAGDSSVGEGLAGRGVGLTPEEEGGEPSCTPAPSPTRWLRPHPHPGLSTPRQNDQDNDFRIK